MITLEQTKSDFEHIVFCDLSQEQLNSLAYEFNTDVDTLKTATYIIQNAIENEVIFFNTDISNNTEIKRMFDKHKLNITPQQFQAFETKQHTLTIGNFISS